MIGSGAEAQTAAHSSHDRKRSEKRRRPSRSRSGRADLQIKSRSRRRRSPAPAPFAAVRSPPRSLRKRRREAEVGRHAPPAVVERRSLHEWSVFPSTSSRRQEIPSTPRDIYVIDGGGERGPGKAIATGVAWDMQPRYSPNARDASRSDRSGGDNLWYANATVRIRSRCRRDVPLPAAGVVAPTARPSSAAALHPERSLAPARFFSTPPGGDGLQLTISAPTRRHRRAGFRPRPPTLLQRRRPLGHFSIQQGSNGDRR